LTDKESEYSCVNTRPEKVQFEVNYKSVLAPENNNEEDDENDKEEEDSTLSKAKASTEVAADQTHDNNNPLNKTEDKQKPEIPATPPQTTQDGSIDGDGDATNNDDDKDTKKKPVRRLFRSDDPISWYGILVPPSLRNAQRSFTDAVDGGIPQLMTVVRDMQYVESLVYDLRRQIKTAA
jgi:coiled-coil domain-containing protein 115